MADGDIGSVQDTLEYDTVNSLYNRIIKRSDSIAAIVYTDDNGDQKVVTVQVDAAGQITDTVLDTLIFNGGVADFLSIAERTPGMYVIYGNMNLDASSATLWAVTVSVSGAGALPAAIIDSLKFATGGLYNSSLIYLTGNIMVGADVVSGNAAWIRTFDCSAGGTLDVTEIESYRYFPNSGANCDICKVSGGVVAVVSGDTGGELKLWTYLINAAGNITTPAHDTLVLAAVGGDGDICHVIGNIYAIAYEGGGTDGFICTVNIDSGGNIGGSVIETYEFETSLLLDPAITKVTEGIVAIAYTGPSSYGYIKTIAIDAAGDITTPFLDELEYAGAGSEHQDIVFMQGNIYLIAHKWPDADGFVTSVDVVTPVTAASKHLMMMGVG